MIYIEVIRKKWEPGIELGVNDRNFEKFMAEEYVKLVRKRIEMQAYLSKWKELNPRYRQWKIDNGLSPKIWEATGDLKNNLKVKSKNVVGFDNRLRHRMSGAKYIDIARRLEYGDGKVPARPLFRLVFQYMSKNIRFFYYKYMKEGNR